MGDPTAIFAIELKDETSGAANNAATALKRLKSTIDQDVKALSAMRKAMRNLKGGSGPFGDSIVKLKNQIAAQKASIASSQRKFLDLGGALDGASDKTKSLDGKMGALKGGLKGSGDALGGLGSSVARFSALLANPITLVLALVAALGAFIVATGAAVAALLRYGLAQSGARRSEALRLEGLISLRAQMGRTTASIGEMQTAIDRAQDATGLGRSQLEGYARQLTRVGLRGESLALALEGTAIAASVQGERGARRFRALAVSAALAGRSVRDLTDDYRRRLGPIARRQMLSLDNQSRRVRQGLQRIFSGLRIESFLGAISEITDQFSQTSETGKALKAIIEAVFQPLFSVSGTLGPIFRRFFQGMIIGALRVTIVFLRVRNAIRDAIGNRSILSNAQLMNAALAAGTLVVAGLAAGFAVLAVGVALVVAGFVLFTASVLAIPATIAAAAAALTVGFLRAVRFIRTINFRAIGAGIINGIRSGIQRGISRLTGSIRRVAMRIRNTFRRLLGISSPSTVFAEFGLNISRGLSQGIGAGQAQTDQAMGRLVQAPVGGGLASLGMSITIGEIVVNAGETSDPRALAMGIREALADVLEGVSIEVGAT